MFVVTSLEYEHLHDSPLPLLHLVVFVLVTVWNMDAFLLRYHCGTLRGKWCLYKPNSLYGSLTFTVNKLSLSLSFHHIVFLLISLSLPLFL